MIITSKEFKAKVFMVMKAIARAVWVFLSNMYTIPAHLLMMTLLKPMTAHFPEIYNYLHGLSFRSLQLLVAHWMYSADYKVAECGDDLKDIEDDETLILSNHQSTADVPAMMYVLQFHGRVLDNILWIMDIMFYHTNFGWVSRMRSDFFIQQGKATRALQGVALQKHIKDYYLPLERKWICLFPEGNFFWKQKKNSQAYGLKHGLPHLEHCLLPRAGAVNAVLEALAPHGNNNKVNPLDRSNRHLKWIVDITIAYPKGVPLNLQTIISGHRNPMITTIHFRKFPVDQVPVGEEKVLKWLCDRYVEKDQLLDTFYKTGKFPASEASGDEFCEARVLELPVEKRFGVHLFYFCLTYMFLCAGWWLLTSLWSALCFMF